MYDFIPNLLLKFSCNIRDSHIKVIKIPAVHTFRNNYIFFLYQFYIKVKLYTFWRDIIYLFNFFCSAYLQV